MLPFHPTIAHMPIVLSVILPLLVLIFAYMMKTNRMTSTGWLIIVGLQVMTTVTGYLALESGEVEEHKVEKVLEKKLINEHEEAAEIFVGFSVLSLVAGIAAFFIRTEYQLRVQLLVFALALVSGLLGTRTGTLGGDLVYKHGAGEAYKEVLESEGPEGILPTPGKNTSESPFPIDDEEHVYSPDEDEHKDED
jgi:uncharacterized membrane protein